MITISIKMTALTALRTSFKETAESDFSREIPNNWTVSTQQQHHSRQRFIDETYPELSLNQTKKHKVKLRYQTPSLPATIEDASEDEESVAINNYLLSTRNLEGRSPYVLPPEELFRQNLLINQDFSSHPLISPKFQRRPSKLLWATKTISAGQLRGFNDRTKRPLLLLGERRSSANFDSLSVDFSDLPPIPEIVRIRKIAGNDGSNSNDEESEDENIFGTRTERSDTDVSSACTNLRSIL
ncbi:Acetyl-coenzyme A carboxylase carboxyl transferase subunit beta [Dirofilaria immitis]